MLRRDLLTYACLHFLCHLSSPKPLGRLELNFINTFKCQRNENVFMQLYRSHGQQDCHSHVWSNTMQLTLTFELRPFINWWNWRQIYFRKLLFEKMQWSFISLKFVHAFILNLVYTVYYIFVAHSLTKVQQVQISSPEPSSRVLKFNREHPWFG